MSQPNGEILFTLEFHRQKCSINPMTGTKNIICTPDRFSAGIAEALAALPASGPCPKLIVDSALAIPAVKAAIAQSGIWPGSGAGHPLPWCGTLEQAWSEQSLRAITDTNAPLPREMTIRAVQLAQLLLDAPGIAESLGHSPSAAIDLAGQWVGIFDGWEWLEAAGTSMDSTRAGKDTQILAALQSEHRCERDRAQWASIWMARMRAEQTGRDQGLSQSEPTAIWFLTGGGVSARDVAMACVLWGSTQDQVTVWRLPQVPHAADSLKGRGDGRQRLISAVTLEQTARSAADTIMNWRRQGLDDIAVLALDRRVVRRLRALLESAGELMDDRSGWALDTSVVATALVGLNDCLQGQLSTRSILEWIHSPLIAQTLSDRHGLDIRRRQSLDDILRASGRVAPIRISDLVSRGLLPDLGLPTSPPPARQSLHAWVASLLDAADAMGLLHLLLDDAAGQALVASLETLRAQAAPDDSGALVSASLWNSVLDSLLHQSRFVEPNPGSAVRTCSMASLLWRKPRAVIWIGADAARLPGRQPARFFDAARFADMGLQLAPEEEEADGLARFAAILQQDVPMCFVACSESPDSEVVFSPWLEMLIGPDGLSVETAASQLLVTSILTGDDFRSPAVPLSWTRPLPEALSVSELQTLVECPYRFLVESLMGLRPLGDIPDEPPPSDLGALLHRVLAVCAKKVISQQDWREELAREVDRQLDMPAESRRTPEAMRFPMPEHIRQRLRAEAMAMLPALADWLCGRTAPGGEAPLVDAELPLSRDLPNVPVRVKGRIDRRERHVHQTQVIDFKTTSAKELRKRLKGDPEDLQLALYAWMTELAGPDDQAFYLAMHPHGCEAVALADAKGGTVESLGARAVARVETEITRVISGGAIAPLGRERDARICEYCSARGVCRRDDSPLLTEVSAQVDAGGTGSVS